MKPRFSRRLVFTAALAHAMSVASQASPITRSNTADNLNVAAAWIGGTAPGTANTATWDAVSSLANTMGGNNTWGALDISTASGAVSFSGANALLLNHDTDASTIFNTGANDFTWGAAATGGNFNINGAAGSTSSTATGASFAGSGTVTISSTGQKNWSTNGTTNGVTNITFTGTLALRGATIPAVGTLPGNWLALGGGGGAASDLGTTTQTGSFALDTGDGTSCGALILTQGWSGQFLKLKSLSGTGSIRADWGISAGTQTRGIELDQAGDTTLSGSLLAHNGSSQRRNISFVKKGAGTLTLAGAIGTSGGTASLTFDLQGGKIQMGNGGSTPTIVGGLDTTTATFALASGTELVFNRTGTFNWPYIHSGSGTIRVNQPGGTLAFTGNSASFAGNVQVDQGTVYLGSSLGSAAVTAEAGTIIVAGLQAAAGTSEIGSLVLKDLSESDFRIGTTSDKINVAGSLTAPGTGETHTINVFNDPTAGGTITLIDYNGPALTTDEFSRFELGILPSLGGFQLVNNTANTSIDLQITLQDQIWKGFANGNWDLSTENWALESTPLVPAAFSLNNPALFDDSASAFSVVVDASGVSPLSLTFNNSVNAYSFTGGEITGSTSLVKGGSAKVTLDQANTYTGGTIISNGTLQIGNGGNTGDIGFGAVVVDGTLEFNRSNATPGTADLNYSMTAKMRNVSGTGNIVLKGGLLLFNYTGSGIGFADSNSWNNFSGNLTVKEGSEFQTIRNGATAMGTGDVILGDGSSSGALSQIEGNWTWTNDISLVGSNNSIRNRSGGIPRSLKLQGVISGSGGLTFEDPAVTMTNNQTGFILTGANTLNGTLTINSGVPVRVGGVPGNDASTAAGTGGSLSDATVVNNGILTFSRSDSHSVSNNISGGGSVFVGLSTGNTDQQMTYSGSATHSGGTTVRAGTLTIAPSGTIGGSSLTVSDGATVVLDGSSIADSTTLNLGVSAIVNVTGTEVVEMLFIDGNQMASGTYGATGSGADHIDDTRFTGGGVVSVTTGPAAGFSTWAATNAPGQTIDQDHDGDGVPNGVEYFMGLSGSGFTSNPSPNASGLISWPKGGSYTGTYGADYAIQISSDLGISDPWTDVPIGNVIIDGDSVDYDLDTAPAGASKFARIKVTGP